MELVSDMMRLGGYLPWGATPTHLQVFQGDKLIHDNQFSADMQWEEVPAGTCRTAPSSTRSDRPTCSGCRPARTPSGLRVRHRRRGLLRAVLGAEAGLPLETDLHGDVKAGTAQQIALRPMSSDLGTVPGTVTTVTLDVSYDDGDTWREVRLTRKDGDWWGGRSRPGSGGFVSVRASAETDAGYSIKHEIIRAYGLR